MQTSMGKRIILSVISDLVTDQRVHRAAQTLHEAGFEVLLVGRLSKHSLPLNPRDYRTRRLPVIFQRKLRMYALFNLRLFLFLLVQKTDLLLANDLDTLLPNYLVSRMKGKPLIYDSHEYFLGMPELQKRPGVRRVWSFIERSIFPRLDYISTVNESLAALYAADYGKKVMVIRNIALYQDPIPGGPIPDLAIPPGRFILIYQGSLHRDRGIEEVIECLHYLPRDQFHLLIVGSGLISSRIRELASRDTLRDQITMIPSVAFAALGGITRQAHLGLSLEKPSSLNNYYCLPNKIFDYLHSGIPILASRLPEIEKIIMKYEVGDFIPDHDPQHIAGKIRKIREDSGSYQRWKANTRIAARELCWQQEKSRLLELVRRAKAREVAGS